MSKALNQAEKVNKFFSDFAVSWDLLYGGKRHAVWRWVDRTFRRDVYERYRMTFERLGVNLDGKTILDVGCGSGVYCLEAAQRGAKKVVGIDISGNMIKMAQEHSNALGYDHICEFICTKFPPEVPYAALEMTFDYGIVMGVMDYVAEAGEFLRDLRSLISQLVVVSFPGQHWLREPLRKYRYRLLGRCNLYSYDEQKIKNAFHYAGFRRIDIKRLDHSGICYIVTAFTR
jgi:2-polyprenyl-3-methyl-5-hydroxy-6-metoxy-1,4-benzoquinol methylase